MRFPLVLLAAIGGAFAQAKPNFVIIMADDCTFTDLEIHGGQAKTPNLKALCSEGMTFQRCFQAAPMCSPTRHNLYTGLYPVKSGAWPNHTQAYPEVRSIAHHLQKAGYRTHLSGKRHIGPEEVFPFEYSGRNNPDIAAISKFFGECAEGKKPFLLIAASNEPHAPWNKGDSSAYPPKEIQLSPIQVDTPATRKALAAYFAEITYFDSQIGEVIEALSKHGLEKNTMVIVLSEQGYQLPFAKWTCYDKGVRSACVVRWPAKVAPASKSEAMVEYVDIVPTLLDAAGVTAPEGLDGHSFLPVLTGKKDSHKDYVFSLQTSKGIHSGPVHYGIRSVRGERYRYVRNLSPDVTFRNIASGTEPFLSWIEKAKAGDALARELTHDYLHRPAEELYDCVKDPFNRHNLIDDPGLATVLNELRGQLDAWMKSQGDKGQATEELALTRMPGKGRKPGRKKSPTK